MIEAQKLNEGLAHFYGTQEYHRWSILFRAVMTDGAKYLADHAECYWLMDMIASHAMKQTKENRRFLVAKIKKGEGNSATFTLEDGNYNVLAKQEIEYTDFCLDEYELFVQSTYDANGEYLVIMLKNEY